MKISQVVLIVLSSMILPLIFFKAYKNQVIVDNKRVLEWRALQVRRKKVGLDLLGLQPKNTDQAPFIKLETIINN